MLLRGAKSTKNKVKNLIDLESSRFEGGTIGSWTEHDENNGASPVLCETIEYYGRKCLHLQAPHTSERARRWVEIAEDVNGETIVPGESYILEYKYINSTRGLTVHSSSSSRWYTTTYLNGPILTDELVWNDYESLPFAIPYDWIAVGFDETWDKNLYVDNVVLRRV